MSKLKVGIIVFLGTNCEQDTKRACEFFGWDTEYIWQNDKIEKNYDIIFIPGGFSYGDHISAGRIAKLSNAIKSLPVGKSLIVGICNGFQILCESKLLPGALIDNQNIKFISKVSEINFQGEGIFLPIAHHQGNYTCQDIVENEILMTYKNNENGSDKSIAGIYDRKNKIIGMMPHPERAIYQELGLTDGRKVFEFVKNQI
ncbi:MAG: phosphoribosylformylglycinamidine synthase I [Candidatus Gastranaerophilales bacterium]|nr:phosphoribosylformylglycinamidine synthase I [Candidatus Gastranaerophilales bacterium]